MTTSSDTKSSTGPSEDQGTAYVSKTRNVHLVCTSPPDSAFVSALTTYLAELGLRVCQHNLDSTAALHDFVQTLLSGSNPAQVAVLPMEGQQPGVNGAPPTPGVRLSPLTVAAIELCAAELSPEHCLAVAQHGDPVECGELAASVLRLSNSPEARAAFKECLSDAGCTIAGEILEEDQPDRLFEFPRDWWGITAESHATLSFTEFLVDSAFNRELTQTKLQEEAMARVRDATELDLKYHYVGWKMAENWNALTDDKTYAHAHHRSSLAGAISDMTAVLPKDTSFRYVSLGPGDGKTDAAVLPALANELDITSCFFVDVSIELLQVATNRVITELIETGRLSPRHIRAVLGDFEEGLSKLAPVLSGFGDKSFFSLSGFTIGNSTERNLIVSLAGGMQPGDFLLLDARLHGLGKVTSISEDQKKAFLEPYESKAMKKFSFGPVEDLCDYTVRLGEPEAEPEIEIEYEPCIGTSVTTDVSNAINVYIDAKGMYVNEAFRAKVGLKPLSSLQVITSREKKKTLRLVTLTFYDFDSLVQWFGETGLFKVCWKRDLGRSGLFLLERLADDAS
ncbi:MAG: hypothetical protein ABW196_02435 [Solirubrobacterales bacterium]